MKMRTVVLTRDAYGRRALVGDDTALRLFPDPCGPEQKAAQWLPITPEQRSALLAAARNQQTVTYDPDQSARYGRPIWH